MIKKFEEYISEGFWKDGIRRAKNNDIRREDGVKVKLQLGPTVVLKNTNWDYDKFLLFIVGFGSPVFGVKRLNVFTLDEQKNILTGKLDYYHPIDIEGSTYVISFESYSEMVDGSWFGYFDIDDPCEEDYIAVIKGLVEKMHELPLYYADKIYLMIELIDKNTLNKLKSKYGESGFDQMFSKFKNEIYEKIKLAKNKTGFIEKTGDRIGVNFDRPELGDFDKIKQFTKQWWKI